MDHKDTKKIYLNEAPEPIPVAPLNPFPFIRVYLAPIMRLDVRALLNKMEVSYRNGQSPIPNGHYLTLAVIRAAMDLRQQDSLRIRMGLLKLIRNVLHVNPADLILDMKNSALLQRFGVLRRDEKLVAPETQVIPKPRVYRGTDKAKQKRSMIEAERYRVRKKQQEAQSKTAVQIVTELSNYLKTLNQLPLHHLGFGR